MTTPVHYRKGCQHVGPLAEARLLVAQQEYAEALNQLTALRAADEFPDDIQRSSCHLNAAYCELMLGTQTIGRFEELVRDYERQLMSPPSGQQPDYPTIAELRGWRITACEGVHADEAHIAELRRTFLYGLPQTPGVLAHHLVMLARQERGRNLSAACDLARRALDQATLEDRPCLHEGVGRVLAVLLSEAGQRDQAFAVLRRVGVPADAPMTEILRTTQM